MPISNISGDNSWKDYSGPTRPKGEPKRFELEKDEGVSESIQEAEDLLESFEKKGSKTLTPDDWKKLENSMDDIVKALEDEKKDATDEHKELIDDEIQQVEKYKHEVYLASMGPQLPEILPKIEGDLTQLFDWLKSLPTE